MCALTGIRALCQSGAKAHANGDALNAEFMLRQAYTQARQLNSPVLEAKILNTLAVFAMEDKRVAFAIPLLAQAEQKVAARIGTSNKLYTVIRNNLRQAQEAGG